MVTSKVAEAERDKVSWFSKRIKLDRRTTGTNESFKGKFYKGDYTFKKRAWYQNGRAQAASVGDNVDIKTVNKLIDEIGEIKATMAKRHFANKQKVRAL